MDVIISDQIVRAFGWTLAHSVWQAILMAALLYGLLKRTPKAAHRYRLAYGALVSVLGAAVLTFAWYCQPEVAQTPVPLGVTTEMPTPNAAMPVPEPADPVFSWEPTFDAFALADWLEQRASLLVALWGCGFLFFGVRLTGGLFQLRRLRRHGLSPVPEAWEMRLEILSERLGLRRKVRFFESALTKTPMTAGWLKPVVLFPIGLINQLGPAQVEAVLAHELAHLARRDWIFNLLQAFIESIFYYHPAVWWISDVARTERENSCDDLAVALTGNPLAFAKALVQVQERAQSTVAWPVPALFWRGTFSWMRPQRPALLERVRRILHQPQPSSPIMEKWIATSLLLALMLFCGLRATRNNPLIQSALAQLPDSVNLFDANTPEPSLSVEADSIPKRKQKITRDDGKQRVEMEVSDGKIVRLNVDGQEIPAADIPKYSELTNDVRRDVTPPPPPPFPALAPTSPMEPFDPIAPMAPMSPMSPTFPRTPIPPAAPRAFYFGGPGEVSASKDKDGNVVLRVEQDGKPVELTIKDGSVWHDGRKLEDGETLKLMGGEDDNRFFYWNDGEGNSFNLGNGSFSFSEDWGDVSKQALEEARAEMDRRREHLREARKLTDEQRREMEREMAKAREQMKRAQDEMRQNIHKQQAELRRAEAEMARAEREMARSQSDARHSQAYAWGPARSYGGSEDRISEHILAELKQDGLVKNPNKYSYSLSQKKLEVNGKKQSSELLQKYLKLYEDVAGKALNGTISFSVNKEEK